MNVQNSLSSVSNSEYVAIPIDDTDQVSASLEPNKYILTKCQDKIKFVRDEVIPFFLQHDRLIQARDITVSKINTQRKCVEVAIVLFCLVLSVGGFATGLTYVLSDSVSVVETECDRFNVCYNDTKSDCNAKYCPEYIATALSPLIIVPVSFAIYQMINAIYNGKIRTIENNFNFDRDIQGVSNKISQLTGIRLSDSVTTSYKRNSYLSSVNIRLQDSEYLKHASLLLSSKLGEKEFENRLAEESESKIDDEELMKRVIKTDQKIVQFLLDEETHGSVLYSQAFHKELIAVLQNEHRFVSVLTEIICDYTSEFELLV